MTVFLLLFHPIDRNPEDAYDDRGTRETERTVRTDVDRFLIDIIPIETYSPDCHPSENREDLSADSEVPEQRHEKYDRIDDHCKRWEWVSEELRSR